MIEIFILNDSLDWNHFRLTDFPAQLIFWHPRGDPAETKWGFLVHGREETESLANRTSKASFLLARLEQDNRSRSAADQMLPSINIPTLKDIYRSLSKAEQLSNKGNH